MRAVIDEPGFGFDPDHWIIVVTRATSRFDRVKSHATVWRFSQHHLGAVVYPSSLYTHNGALDSTILRGTI